MSGILPNCIVIGAAKCGTSSMKSYLGAHPDVFMLHGREPHFFCRDDLFSRGTSWYRSLFAEAADHKVVAEGTNAYSEHARFPETASRMWRILPEAKLIYVVRHPMRRIESYWLQLRSHGGTTTDLDFSKAILAQHERYVDPSNYWRQIQEYLAFFPRSQCHVVFLEELESDPDGTMKRCFDFLGVPHRGDPATTTPVLNPSVGKRLEKPLMQRLRGVPGYRRLRYLLPANLRRSAKERLLSSPVSSRPAWDDSVRDRVCDELLDDARRFLEWCGKPTTFWDPL